MNGETIIFLGKSRSIWVTNTIIRIATVKLITIFM